MKKRILSLMLTFVMVIGIMPAMEAKAEVTASGTCGDNLTWVLDNEGTLTISGEGEMENYSDCYAVPWFASRADIKMVAMEKGVTNISAWAFFDCYNLITTIIPDSVTSMGDCVFCGCSNLSETVIPDGVTSIDAYAFEGCGSLTEIVIPNGVTSIGNNAFSNCYKLSEITIPDGVTNIGAWAFSNCNSLTDITIPGSVTSMGEQAFYSCDSLSELTIPDSLTTIDVQTFCYCYSLITVTILDGVTSIDDRAFCGCENLNEITIPDSVTSIEHQAFYNCNSLSDVYYNGTEEQWNEIKIGSSNSPLTDATIHFKEPESVEMDILENSYFESADKTKFDVGFVTDALFNHNDFKTLKFAFTDGEETTYMGYAIEKLGLPTITAEEGAEILLGIVLHHIPIKYKDNVRLTLTSEELK